MSEPDSDFDARETPSPEYVDDDADDSLLSPDDIGIPREADGTLRPERVHVERLGGEVETKPIRERDFNDYVRPFVGGQTDQISSEDMAYLIEEYIVHPDLTDRPDVGDELSPEWVENSLPQEQEVGLLIAMLKAGGYQETAGRLEGNIPEAERDLLVEVLKDDDIDLAEAAGNDSPARRRD